ncbi:hypothetical protein SARC_03079 [Sphaeroforma arctica JP610]|uniref:Uncharacterized protein n=1 Tax=Sphaeroforma arctica JP610 TaxID=667725 RepID=A0A0L0G702_9EUKA|nr:hypothetical protein SARC_03079 [Sphaeroforma arctica JP610]KNC84704.1 hypothetical protein SARC_03079 [Sphaeroforma arctica JP610]|eukprot:XP_014158606.1 hypothetical protein SARC_03079 [Sphaeroforma arctica JP610]
MGNVDSVPIVSQAKSAVQACHGDMDGATRTQENFSKQCVIISQVRSAIEVSMGDTDAATATQLEFIDPKNLAAQAGVVVGAVVAPIVAVASVSALGFGAGGIVAGSPAAGIMAYSGGAVASGSTCAVLQSVGAAGLGAASTSALVVGGGLATGSALAETAACIPGYSGNGNSVGVICPGIDLHRSRKGVNRKAPGGAVVYSWIGFGG